MPKPRALILRAPGTNCDRETAYAFERAGATADRVHVNRVLERPQTLVDYQVLCIPGGFSYGDDLAAGRILGMQIHQYLGPHLHEFREAGKLILGICNGFQVLAKSGLLFDNDPARGPAGTLTWNDSGHFEDRWIHLLADSRRVATESQGGAGYAAGQADADRVECVFLQGVESMFLPIAHAEGKFVPRDEETLAQLEAAGQLALRYGAVVRPESSREPELVGAVDTRLPSSVPSHRAARGSAARVTDEQGTSRLELARHYPANPNGSVGAVAGVCDSTGRVLGLMPHPERHVDPTQHPFWTRFENLPEKGDGLVLFENAVEYFR